MSVSQKNAAKIVGINRRMWWVSFVLAFVGLSFAIITTSQMWLGLLNDSDDYVRMVRVFDLLNGQGWYDLRVLRLSPEEQFVLPWSRLIDAPLAAVMLLVQPSLGMMGASGVAAFIVPLLWLGVFCFVLPLIGRGMIAQRYGWALIIVMLCNFSVLRELRPMRVDHHGPQMVFALCALASLVFYHVRPRWHLRVLAGLFCACGLAIGAESFLWTVLTTGYIALHAAWNGRRAAKDAPAFGAGLLGGLIIWVPVLRLPADWFVRDLALPALPHLVLAALILVVLFGLSRVAGLRRGKRMNVLVVAGLAAAALLMLVFPELQRGVYATNMNDDNRALVLGNVIEAQSFWQRLLRIATSDRHALRDFWPLIGHNLVLPLLACGVVIVQFIRSQTDRRRGLWLLHGCFLLPVTILSLLWQSRVGFYMGVYSLLPLAWVLLALLRQVQRVRMRILRWPLHGLALLLLPLPSIVLSLVLLRAHPAQIAFFPAWHVQKSCDFKAVADILNEPRFAAAPLNLLTALTGGAELMYRTPHRVFAAPYDVAGNVLAMQFFSAKDIGSARLLAQMHGVDLVLMCTGFAALYLADPVEKAAVQEADIYRRNGISVPPELKAQLPMVDFIVSGDVPDWLEPIPLLADNMRLYRVKPMDGASNPIGIIKNTPIKP